MDWVLIGKMALSYGIFAVLFCMLLKYVLDENAKREEKYQKTIEKNQNIISKLVEKLNIVEQLKDDVEEIKEIIQR